LFLFSYVPVYAEWVVLEKQYQPTSLETVSFDPNTIQRAGGQAALWQLTDIKWNSTTRFLSSKIHKGTSNNRVLKPIASFSET